MPKTIQKEEGLGLQAAAFRFPNSHVAPPRALRRPELLAPAGDWECAKAAVENGADVPPITTARRFRIASLSTFDPFVYPFVALTAGIADLRGQEPAWSGGSGYMKHYAVAFTDNAVGNMFTTAIVSTLADQDPRYFVLGTGGFWRRAAYAASRSVVTRRRDRLQFNVSELGGNAAAAALSNLYYPAPNRSLAATLDRWQTQVMWDTLSNELKEFWPDLRQALLHR